MTKTKSLPKQVTNLLAAMKAHQGKCRVGFRTGKKAVWVLHRKHSLAAFETAHREGLVDLVENDYKIGALYQLTEAGREAAEQVEQDAEQVKRLAMTKPSRLHRIGFLVEIIRQTDKRYYVRQVETGHNIFGAYDVIHGRPGETYVHVDDIAVDDVTHEQYNRLADLWLAWEQWEKEERTQEEEELRPIRERHSRIRQEKVDEIYKAQNIVLGKN